MIFNGNKVERGSRESFQKEKAKEGQFEEVIFKLRPDQRQSPSALVWGRALQTRGAAKAWVLWRGGGLSIFKN